MRRAQKAHTTRRGEGHAGTPYWWTAEIAALRTECISTRRRWLRACRAGRSSPNAVAARTIFDERKKALRRAIRGAKRTAWKGLCQELENDMWGQGYKLVTRHLRRLLPTHDLPDDEKVEIARKLFPVGRGLRYIQTATADIPPITLEELKGAAEALRSGTAPGTDGITPQTVKHCVEDSPGVIRDLLNGMMLQQTFPEVWKEAKVVLIPKSSEGNEKKFRPICLLKVLGKLYEVIIRNRLTTFLEDSGALSQHQFGFRRGRSTIMAIERACGATHRRDGKWAVLVLLDVRNAFNTADWEVIIRKLTDRDVPIYLVNIVGDYLKNREIVVGGERLSVSAGVPQGSVLGPTLWNVLYDDVLRLPLPPGVDATAYADDLALTVVADGIPALNSKARRALDMVSEWMVEHGLRLAPEKTEAVVLKGPYKRDAIDLRILRKRIEISREVVYLGVTIDTQGYFGRHVVNIREKADRRTAALTRLMPNIGGPSYMKRSVYWGVIQSTILYAAPIWNKALRIGRYKNIVTAVQRKALLRILSAYRTVSAEATQVLAGVPPIDLLVDERARIWGRGGDPPQEAMEARNETMRRWQSTWDENMTKAQWTKRLIPRLTVWTNCNFKTTDYFLTQFFTGHGSFRTYTKRIGRDEVDGCRYCGIIDSPEHTGFYCPRWERERLSFWGAFAGTLTTENIVDVMVASKKNWQEISRGIREIMRLKETEERAFQAGNLHGFPAPVSPPAPNQI